jgi:hypothetical protein
MRQKNCRWLPLLTLVAALLAPVMLQAQTVVVNPSKVVFAPSPDHSLNGLDGTPLVAKYLMRFFAVGADQATGETDLGKPTIGTDGNITVTNRAAFTLSVLAMNTPYVVKMVASGTTGEGASAVSNPFGNAAAPRPPGAAVLSK